MCKIGDIIVIQNYVSRGKPLNRHSFIVLDDRNGEIEGLPFDFISLVMSSFKDEEQKAKKLKYPGNFPIVSDDVNIAHGNTGSGYVKAEQLYLFKRATIKYQVIGSLKPDIFNLLVEFIQALQEQGIQFEYITDNL